MRQRDKQAPQSAEEAVRDIRRATRRHFSAEEKIRIVVEGLRGEDSIAELCRKEGIAQNLYYRWSKEFLEAGKKRLAGDTAREATPERITSSELISPNSSTKRRTQRRVWFLLMALRGARTRSHNSTRARSEGRTPVPASRPEPTQEVVAADVNAVGAGLRTCVVTSERLADDRRALMPATPVFACRAHRPVHGPGSRLPTARRCPGTSPKRTCFRWGGGLLGRPERT